MSKVNYFNNQINVEGKKILIRLDLNVPLNNKLILDDTRIKVVLPFIKELLEKNSKFICSTHPHNYYLEILTELGIFGFFIILIIFSLTLYLTLIKKYILNSQLKNNHIITPFLFIFIVEIFPVKSTGSFFTTGNSTFIFLVLAIILGLSKNSNLIETNHKKDKLI